MRMLRWYRRPALLAVLLCAPLAGCFNSSSVNPIPDQQSAGTQATDSHPGSSDKEVPVDVRVVKYDELMNAVKKLEGKVVVVDFWSLT